MILKIIGYSWKKVFSKININLRIMKIIIKYYINSNNNNKLN